MNTLNIEINIEIDRVHRFGKRRGSRPLTIVWRFLIFKENQKVFQIVKKLKDTGVYIYIYMIVKEKKHF